MVPGGAHAGLGVDDDEYGVHDPSVAVGARAFNDAAETADEFHRAARTDVVGQATIHQVHVRAQLAFAVARPEALELGKPRRCRSPSSCSCGAAGDRRCRTARR